MVEIEGGTEEETEDMLKMGEVVIAVVTAGIEEGILEEVVIILTTSLYQTLLNPDSNMP
jgi:hypothetical protein